MEGLIYILFLSVATALGVLKYFNRYWDRKGFVSIEPSYLFGNFNKFLKKQVSFNARFFQLYWESLVTPYLGIYLLFRPALLLRDPKIIKRILVKDFDNFRSRRFFFNHLSDALMLKIVQNKEIDESIYDEGQLLTSEKQIKIFKSSELQSHRLNECLVKIADEEKIVNMNDVAQKFSVNVISSIFFDLDVNVWENPDHYLLFLMQTNSKDSYFTKFKQILLYSHPK